MSQKTITLQHKLEHARSNIQPGSVWKHYKGGVYKIYDHVILTEDGEVGIEYYRIDGPDFDLALEANLHFVRPMSEWFDIVFIGMDENIEPQHVRRFLPAKKRTIWDTQGEGVE